MSNDKTLSFQKIVLLIGVYGFILFFFPLLMYLIFKEGVGRDSNQINVPFMLLTVNTPIATIQCSRRTRFRVFLLSIIPLLACSVGGNAFWSCVLNYQVDWQFAFYAFSIATPAVVAIGLFVIVITSLKIHRNV